MKTKIVIGLLCIATVLPWIGIAGAQATPAPPKVQLPSGETVWDLSGDWDAQIENYGPAIRDGTGTNVYCITQNGSAFQAIRTKDDPLLTKEATERGHSPWGRAGSLSLQGEVAKTGFKHVQIVFGSGGRIVPSQGHMGEDGKKIVIDNRSFARVILTRAGEPGKIKAMLLRPAGWKAEWSEVGTVAKGEGEYLFEARGDKVVVKIQHLASPTTCERDVTVTSDGAKFDACRDLDITLRFDPNDLDYPFKGKSLSGFVYKVRAK